MNLPETIQKLDMLFQKWKGMQPLSIDAADKLWQKLRLEWNFNSNHIEGNTLTYGETKLLLMFDKTTGDHLLREYEEMKAHDLAVHLVKEWAADTERELTEADIRELNKVILVKPFWKEALTRDGDNTRRLIDVGTYKKHPNSVRTATGEIFHYASPEETPQLMTDLMKWYRDNQDVHPAILAAEMHYRFIRIHPFDDGNGRIARLLVNYILMRNNYPPTVIKSENKNAYLTALQKADAGDREAFQAYMAEQVIWSLQIGIRAGEGKSVEEDDDLDKEVELLKRNQKSLVQKKQLTHKLAVGVLNEAYIPLLELLSQRLQKFDDLFESQHWAFHDENDGNIQSVPVKSSINEIVSYFRNHIDQKIESKHYYKAMCEWNKYKDGSSNFSLAVVLRLYFYEEKYKIEVYIGSPSQSNRMMMTVTEMMKNQQKLSTDFKHYNLIDGGYQTYIDQEDIQDWSKRISNDVLDFIKRNAKK